MKTCVLLSTYNGSKYVGEQIDSIVKQRRTPDYLLIRDDGSSDCTIDICRNMLLASNLNVTYVAGENIGPSRSFIELAKLALKTDADIFFFCDQDDIWEPDKIAIFSDEFRTKKNCHRAVFSRLMVVDEHNTPLELSRMPRKLGLGNALVENVMTGCALACNRAVLVDLAMFSTAPPTLHDHLIYVISTLFGDSIYIPRPLTRYRQHGSNVVGYTLGLLNGTRKRVTRVLYGPRHFKSHLAMTVLEKFSDRISEHDRRTLYLVAMSPHSVSSRFRLALSTRLWRQKAIHSITWRVLCLIGRF